MPLPENHVHTAEGYWNLPDGRREDAAPVIIPFNENIQSGIYDDLQINISEILSS